MKYSFLFLTLLLLAGCESDRIEGIYSSDEGPYFKLNKNNTFEFGIPNDPSPVRGNYKQVDDKLILIANVKMLGNYATTEFELKGNKDTLTIDILHITHPKFEIYINKSDNTAKTVKDSIKHFFDLNSPEAEEELFIYYKLVQDKFIKREGA